MMKSPLEWLILEYYKFFEIMEKGLEIIFQYEFKNEFYTHRMTNTQ